MSAELISNDMNTFRVYKYTKLLKCPTLSMYIELTFPQLNPLNFGQEIEYSITR